MLTIVEHEFEQKQTPEGEISLGCLLKVLRHFGLPHFKIFCLFLARLKHFEEQYCFHLNFLASLVLLFDLKYFFWQNEQFTVIKVIRLFYRIKPEEYKK